MLTRGALGAAIRNGGVGGFRGVDDSFTTDRAGGALNNTPAEPGPGVRSVIDSANRLSLSGGSAIFSTAAANDPRVAYEPFVIKPGIITIWELTPGDTSLVLGMGHTSSATSVSNTFQFNTSGVISGLLSGSAALATYSAGVQYKAMLVNRAPGYFWYLWDSVSAKWKLIGFSVNFAAEGQLLTPNFGARGASTMNAQRFYIPPRVYWLPTPLVSDGFSASTSDGLGHVEGLAGGLGSGGSGVSWTGATWSASGGVLKNTPSQGSNLLTNGDFESWATATDLTNWSESASGASTVNREATIVDSGTYAVRLYVDGASSNVNLLQSITPTIGQWYLASIRAKASAAGAGAGFRCVNNATVQITLTTTWSTYVFAQRATLGASSAFFSKGSSNPIDTSLYGDNYTIVPLTLSTLFRTANLAKADVFASVAVTRTAGTQAGLVLNLDSTGSPANFVVVYHNGTQVVMDKCVAGTYTNLFSATVTYSAGARLEIRKDGTAYRVYYNNAFISTQQTVSDAGITSNTLHGTFSTYSLNEFDDLVIYATGTGGEYAALDNY